MLLEKLIVTQMVKKFPLFRNPKFISVSTTALKWSLS
jgi:hypothetical protein